MRRLVAAAVSTVMVVLAGGCGAEVTAGSPTTASATGLPPVTQVQFDPCTLSDSVLRELQLVPSTQTTYNDGAPQGFETGCGWFDATTSATVSLDVGRSTRTVQNYLDNTDFADISTATVGSHAAAQFTLGSQNAGTLWSLAIGVPNGVVVLTANTFFNKPGETPPDARTELNRMAAVLEPLLPS